jgi:hypothetical protein
MSAGTSTDAAATDVIDGEPLTRRDRAILRAVAGGHAELVFGSEPDLIIDGRCCCDQAPRTAWPVPASSPRLTPPPSSASASPPA